MLSDEELKRFEAKFQELGGSPDACFEWTASRYTAGYGRFGLRGTVLGAHRVAYDHYVGEIPPGMHVLHHCDNPPCVRPSHLFLGTHADNSRDKVAKQRHSFGERNGNAKLTEEQVRAIRRDPRSHGVTAKDYGVSKDLVAQIRRREIWRHVA